LQYSHIACSKKHSRRRTINKQKIQVSKLDTIKKKTHALGKNPEQLPNRETTTQNTTTEKENNIDFQIGFLRSQLRELIKEEMQYKPLM